MTRDMKPRRREAPKKKSAGGTLLGMFIGLVLGIGVAAGVVYYLNQSPLPFVNKAGAPMKPTPAGSPEAAIPLPGKPGDPIPEKRFQFYDILPGKSDPVTNRPEDARKASEEKKAPQEEAKESKQPLFLQTGSFSKPEDADNQKAKLAFMGVEAVVQQVMVQDKTYYRVRVGPYQRLDELNKVRAELAKNGVDAQLAKNKE